MAGGLLAVFLAWISLDAIVANIPMSLPSNSPATLNLKVLASTVVLLVPNAPAKNVGRVCFGVTRMPKASSMSARVGSIDGSQMLPLTCTWLGSRR